MQKLRVFTQIMRKLLMNTVSQTDPFFEMLSSLKAIIDIKSGKRTSVESHRLGLESWLSN